MQHVIQNNDPVLVIFVDEVGDNTSQKADGNINGKNFIVTKTWPRTFLFITQ